MGFDLSGGPYLNWGAWRFCLQTALRYGWKPEGTLAPRLYIYNTDSRVWEERSIPDEQWNGNYFSNDGQFVTDGDAHGLAAALDRAIASLRKAGLGNEDDCRILAMLADRARRGGFSIH